MIRKGGYLFFMSLCIMCTIKMSGQSWKWAKSAGGSGWESANAISPDTAGNVYIAGSFEAEAIFGNSLTLTAMGADDVFLAKYDSLGNLLWAKSGGGSSEDAAHAIAALPEGGCYITGSFTDTAIFDNDTLYSNAADDIFLAKYSDNGQLIWIKHFGGLYDDAGRAVAVMPDGGCALSGYFRQKAYFGQDSVLHNGLFTGGENDMFLARLDAAGNLLWVKGAGASSGYCEGNALCVDANGSIIVAGSFAYTTLFDTVTLTAAPSIAGTGGARDIFIAKYQENGSLAWAKAAGGGGDPLYTNSADIAHAVTADEEGNFWIAGSVYGQVMFDTFVLTSSGNSDGFVAKYQHTDGTVMQASLIGGTGEDGCNGITLYPQQPVAVSGYFTDSIHTNNNTIVSAGATDGFIALLDEQGITEQVYALGNSGSDYCHAVGYNRKGSIFLTGTFSGTALSLPPYTLSSAGGFDVFTAKLQESSPPDAILSPDYLKWSKIYPYPNPFTSYFSIYGITDKIYNLALADISGHTVFRATCKNGSHILPPATLSPGIYFYTLKESNTLSRSGSIVKSN